MTHTSLGLLACGLILACPGGLPLRHQPLGHPQRLASAGATGHVTDCRRHRGVCRGLAEDGGEFSDEALPDSVLDDLDSCSPFVAIDGDKELDFDTATSVVTETAGTSSGLRGPTAAPSTRVTGTFAASDETGRVTLTIGPLRREYTLVIPADGDQCILALGKANAVDLQQSWFGEVSDDPEADPPEYQHVAARHPPLGRTWPLGHRQLAPSIRAGGGGPSPA
jgi:hypothetical protein